MKIKLDNLESPEIIKLLQEHHDEMLRHSPPESVHALDLTALKADDITFWSAWSNDELAGCGALKRLNSEHAEIKSMRTSKQYLRQGVAANLLTHILVFAKTQHYKKVSLETGTMAAFIPAQKLYKNFGFKTCPPFSNYQLDPHSMFLTKAL